MTLQNERERLVTDTLAIVQRLAKEPVARAISSPAAVLASHTPRCRTEADLRNEMKSRLEAFRNRQRFLEIEREAYYQQAMQRIRATTERYENA